MRTVVVFLALSSAAAAQVTVTGKVFYEDRTYDENGFQGIVNRPVRQAEIELLSSPGNAVLQTGVTDDAGAYSLTFVGLDQDVHVRVFTRRSNGTGKINAVVQNNPAAKQVYAVAGPDFNTTTAPADLIITRIGGAGGPFNIFDCAVKSFQYLTSTAVEPTLTDPAPLLTIYWEFGTLEGTYFDTDVSPPAVFLLGGPSDPDEYDDDIIYHEIGHWVAYFFSKDDTPGGRHRITDQLDPRLSWSEGWGHYWSAAVRAYVNAATVPPALPEYAAPSVQVDNFFGSNSNFDLEGPDFASFCIMATNEVAVAAVLWDLLDPPNEAFDRLGGLETEIWRSVRVDIPGRTDITLEDFHAGLLAEIPPSVPVVDISGDPVTVSIFNDRRIRYYADPSEANDSALSAPTISGVLTLRTSYPAGDHDWFTVVADPGTLVVETLNLGDGADTLLQLYDSTGATLLASHDNRSGTDKSSRIAWNVAVTTTYLVRVSQAGMVVEHGYYDLQTQTVAGGGGGNGGCGLTGLEICVLLGILRRARRR